MSHPRPGDRVRIIVEGVVAPEGDVVHAAVLGASPEHLPLIGSTLVDWDILEPIDSQWRHGDIVRNAEDAEDPRLWVVHDPATDDSGWSNPKRCGWWTTVDGQKVRRETLPTSLELVARNGHPVRPEPPTDEIREAAYACFDRWIGRDETPRASLDYAIDELLARMGMPTGNPPF